MPIARAGLVHLVCAPAAIIAGSALSVPALWPGLEGLAAALLGHWVGLAAWWMPINLLFVPVLAAALVLEVPSYWYLAGFTLTALTYWGIHRTQVPLFTTSATATAALADLLPAARGLRFLDLGCGSGVLLARLARIRPDGRFTGVELAPLPWLVGLARLRGVAAARVERGSFWDRDLSGYDVVYAYLSPVPMARLWEKARREMRPGTLLISNTFEIPGVTPDTVVELNETWSARLHVWRM